MVIPVLTEEFRLTEPVTNAFHIRHGKYFVLGTNSLEDELTCMQHSSRILLTVDKHFSFSRKIIIFSSHFRAGRWNPLRWEAYIIALSTALGH